MAYQTYRSIFASFILATLSLIYRGDLMPQSHWGRRYYGLSRSLPGHPGSWTGMNRVKITFFCRKISTVDRRGPQDPGAPRGTPVHSGRAPAGPRFIRRLHGSPRFSGRFTQVHAGRTPVTLRFFPVLHGGATVLPGSPRFIPARWKCSINRTDL